MEAPTTVEDRHALNRNIERTVDKTALRKVRHLVDSFESEEQARRKHQSRIALVTVMVVLVSLLGSLVLLKYSQSQSSYIAARPERVAACEKKWVDRERQRVEDETRARLPDATADERAARVAQFDALFAAQARESCRRTR